ncbi:membrane protein [Devosia limi DSM 17137]|uniref:Hypoxia induced protein conserved region n=1 Tax=Devosia limi DSM 17137 TaxID=1121477 RepID=A0A0F5LUB4_9HYPH|nr:twin transmembrane helix small protein [Devosia limi]KKB85242.1 membrane protein [Devosia limi DSM 17137]SHF87113.1 Hypoxia induced protein conserved region [Devosia limi DSM 17137]
MQTALNFAIALALIFVVVVLGLGLWNMLKGGSGNTSQKLMRLRVMGQAVALVLLLAALFFFGGGGRG